ncbi:response regulator transcription factor [Serratia marcescens]
MELITIAIDDDNNYFAAGLRLSISEYAKKNHKTVSFLTQGDDVRPDVVIASSTWRAHRWYKGSTQATAESIVTIKECRFGNLNENDRVLYRTDSRSRLFELLTLRLIKVSNDDSPSGCTLTSREKQVVGYLKKGFDQSQTARFLGINVKTVHSHKRSVMKKLMLNRQREFMYWLISQDD